MIRTFVSVFTCVLLFFCETVFAQLHYYNTSYATIGISNTGYIKSIKSIASGKEYCPGGDSSALLSLYKDKQYILPVKAAFHPDKKQVTLYYANGAVAVLSLEKKAGYLKLKLQSLAPRNGVDNIVWGPYKTTINQTFGEIISVVRDTDFAIGIQSLDMITTSGPPSEGDLPQSYYVIHAPPGVTLPSHLKEGQRFNIGGDSLGSSDIAFFSQPEEYYRYVLGNGAMITPSGSEIVLHARDRRIPQSINFRPFTMSPDRHQYIAPMDVDFMGSAIAWFGCPEPATLAVIERIVLGEGLPHPEIDGKWVKDPASAKPFMAWNGVHDSLVSYCRQLGFKAVQDEGFGEYYYNPANKWGHQKVNFSNGAMSIKEYTAITNKAGIAYGLHTLCEFIQPGSSDVTPVPNDSLCKVGSTRLIHDISPDDTLITIADPTYLRESGGWEDIRTNVLKAGKELIRYAGVTEAFPYTLIHPERGWNNTQRSHHAANGVIDKLMPNAYHGFAPDMYLQDQYAIAYAQLLNEGGMDYIDFDGLESCWYQGHGQYAVKRFYSTLFKHLHHYVRNTGSCAFEGNWHYLSSLDVGGDLFDPAANQFKIQGKDFKHIYYSNLLHFSFGIVNFSPKWNSAVAENLESKAVGWDGQYMLGLSQQHAEKCGVKNAIFTAIRTWENARDAKVFTAAHKEKFRVLENRFHLEQVSSKHWRLFPVVLRNISLTSQPTPFTLKNPFADQPLEFTIHFTSAISELTLQVNGKHFRIPAAVKQGDYLVCRKGKLYVADENWNKLTDIAAGEIPLIKHGDNEIMAGSSFFKENKPEMVVYLIGKGEELKQ